MATEFTFPIWPLKLEINYPFGRFHILIVLSLPPDTMYLQSALIATEFIQPLCSVSVFTNFPSEKFQILMVLSLLPETMKLLS